jgi:hypothetical protein
LNVIRLFFHIVHKLVQELIVKYDETFLPLAVGADVLLQKLFLNLGVHGVVRCFSSFLNMWNSEWAKSGLLGTSGYQSEHHFV